MITWQELNVLLMWVEWFLYGKISVLCALTCVLLKKSKLFPGLGIYSGIFAIYSQCALKESRTTTIVYYALCLLYVLSTATVVTDLLLAVIEVSTNYNCKNIIFSLIYADAYRCTTGSTSNGLTVTDIPRYDCPNHSKRLL